MTAVSNHDSYSLFFSLIGLVVASPGGAVPRDQILEAAALRFGSDEFLAWGSYCNKVSREDIMEESWIHVQ